MDERLTLAVVPARGGSKRIPRKNVRPFFGVPLIGRTIATLLDSGLFDYVVVSTDDDEIARISEDAGAWVPFRRRVELADDFTPTAPVVLDAVDRVEELTRRSVGEVCVAYPSAVFTTKQDLTSARSLLNRRNADVVMSAAEFSAPILRAWRELPDGSAEMMWPEHALTRSQDLERAYHDAGQFYWWSQSARSKLEGSLPVRTAVFVLPADRVQDIDTEEDWRLAETKFGQVRAKDPD